MINLLFWSLGLIGIPILAFLLGQVLQKVTQESKYKSILQITGKGQIAIFVLAFAFICLYRTTSVWVWLLVLGIPFIVHGFSQKDLHFTMEELRKQERNSLFWLMTVGAVAGIFLLCLKPVYRVAWNAGTILESNRISILYLLVLAWAVTYMLVTFGHRNHKVTKVIFGSACALSVFVLTMKFLWRYSFANSVSIGITSLFSDQIILLNAGILCIISATFFFLLGKGWGTVLNAVLYLFLFFSNYIKIRYHDTIFTWFDLLQFKELLLIGREFITVPIVVGVILGIAVVVFLLVKFKTVIKTFLKPHIMIVPTVVLVILLGVIYGRISGEQYKFLDIYKRTWENEAVNVRFNGLIVNLVLNFNALQEIVMDEPGNYSKQSADELLEQFQMLSATTDVSEENPDVILIMGESLFDMDGVDGLQFDKDIDATIDAYSPGAIISPRYGGYTSAMEFEALTGLTLAFMPPALTPFTTYFNNPDDNFPSVVQEFKKNGYASVAMHPDLAEFYNRTIVYQNMGFDEYLAINAFESTEENTTLNGWIKNDEIAHRIIDELEQSEQPKFVYAVTMEEHYVNVDKYSEPEVQVTSELLDEDIEHTLSQQATSYYHTDQMIRQIIEYMDSTDRPTLLYVFGDHLPPLEALSELGYINDLENKYKTSLVMYSNYKDIGIETEYITTNQLAPQIVKDAGIVHSSYFDYIYSLRESYPVMHQNFIHVAENADLDIYRFIQYDILFGERYLITDNENYK